MFEAHKYVDREKRENKTITTTGRSEMGRENGGVGATVEYTERDFHVRARVTLGSCSWGLCGGLWGFKVGR